MDIFGGHYYVYHMNIFGLMGQSVHINQTKGKYSSNNRSLFTSPYLVKSFFTKTVVYLHIGLNLSQKCH